LLEVTVNDLTLHAYELPPLAFGYFLNSDVQGFVPNVMNSVGNLCLGGDVGRFNRLGEVQNTGLDGAFELTIDLTNFPRPMGAVTVMAGETWNFQAWHRDLVILPTSNFTEGLSLTFE
jgi:hypothetical protein